MGHTKQIHVAIIGYGVIGRVHEASILLDRRATLKVICDIQFSEANEFKNGISYTSDWRSLVTATDLDLIIISTPHHLHAEMAIAFITHGKNVLIEKPVAINPIDVAKISAVASLQTDSVISGVFQHRFTPVIRRLHDFVSLGDFGSVKRVALNFSIDRTDQYYASSPWRGKWSTEGGSLLINQGIHHLDLALWFSGRVKEVSAIIRRHRLTGIECEDYVKLNCQCNNGATIEAEMINDGKSTWDGLLTVQCTNGSFSLNMSDQILSVQHPSAAIVAEILGYRTCTHDSFSLPGKPEYGHSHARQIADVIGSIVNQRQPFITVSQACETAMLAIAAYHSAHNNGEWICPESVPIIKYRTRPLPLF